MWRTCTLLLCLFWGVGGFAASYKGYLITKNNFHLTGFINTVSYTPFGIMVEFTNDFGTTYNIHPALVRGFAFKNGEETFVYISRYYDQQWYFLRIVHLGEALSLYEAPATEHSWVQVPLGITFPLETERYWLQRREGDVLPVRRLGFRGQMRRYLGSEVELLGNKIGGSGYRYRDLLDLVREYNREYAKRKQKT